MKDMATVSFLQLSCGLLTSFSEIFMWGSRVAVTALLQLATRKVGRQKSDFNLGRVSSLS